MLQPPPFGSLWRWAPGLLAAAGLLGLGLSPLASAAPSLSLNPGTAQPGQSVTVSLSGYGANEWIGVHGPREWRPPSGLLGAPYADGQGNATLTFTVPPDARPGSYEISATGQRSGVARATLTVASATTTPIQPEPPPEGLDPRLRERWLEAWKAWMVGDEEGFFANLIELLGEVFPLEPEIPAEFEPLTYRFQVPPPTGEGESPDGLPPMRFDVARFPPHFEPEPGPLPRPPESDQPPAGCECQEIALSPDGYGWGAAPEGPGVVPDFSYLGLLGINWTLRCSPGEPADACAGRIDIRSRTPGVEIVRPTPAQIECRGDCGQSTTGRQSFMFKVFGEPRDQLAFSLVTQCAGDGGRTETVEATIHLRDIDIGGRTYKELRQIDVGDITVFRRRS